MKWHGPSNEGNELWNNEIMQEIFSSKGTLMGNVLNYFKEKEGDTLTFSLL